MAEKGSATAKLSVIPSFEQKNIKAMGDQLVNGIKASLKDIKLESVFNDANILDGVKKEIEQIDDLFKNRTLKRLDFSGLIPPLAQALEDKSLSEEIRLQIIQGFKEGLESGRTFLQGMPSGMTGNEIKEQFRQSTIMSDAVNSLPGLNKNSRATFKKQWAQITEKDIRQLMSMMDIADKYTDVLPFLLDEENAGRMIRENITSTKTGAPQKAVAAIARLQALATQETKNTGKTARQNALNRILDQKIGNETIRQISDRLQETFPDIKKLSSRVYEGTVARDNAYQNISWDASTIDNLLLKTLQRGYKSGALQKIEPLYRGNYTTPSHITLSDLAEASNRTIDRDESQNNESFVERAENAANRAENASEEARAVAEDMKRTVEEGVAEASGTSKKSKKKPPTQASAESAEQIANDAEADAENAERVIDALDDKKTRLESTITELENKNRELQELNNKYQKAISDTFGEVKTPEEALALFKEKAAQLQQADKDFADIVPQRNFTDPSNSEEIAILEEYEKRLAALQQALVEYQKAGETAMGKGVNPTDIRANQVDEERLQLNFADSTIDGYIKGLQRTIENNKKKIAEYENLLKTYKGQLEEFARQGSQSNVKPSGGSQTQSRSVVDTAREETGEVQKSREELQAEREKLEAEIQESSRTMSEAKGQINQIDTTISKTKQNIEDNIMMRLPAVKAAEQSANQKKAKLEETKRSLEQIREEKEQLEKELADVVEQENKAKIAQKRKDWYNDALYGQEEGLGDINIPFEFGKPQKKKAADQLRKFTRMWKEYDKRLQVPEEFREDAEIGASYPDVIRYLHYRAFQEAEKHGVSNTILDQNRFNFDNDAVAEVGKELLEGWWSQQYDAYNKADEIVRQNIEKMNRLHQLQAQEKELQAAQPRQEQEYARAQHDIGGAQQVEEQIQRDKDKLARLQQQRAEQQRIYDDAKRIQEESLQRQAEIDKMIAEAESREQQAPSTTPATSESGGSNGNASIERSQAESEVSQLQKSRKDLEDERKKLLEVIQQSTQTMEEANGQMILIDKKINQTQQSEQRNNTTIDRLTEKKAQIESQIQQTKDELKTIKERLQDAIDAKEATEEEIKALEEKLLSADSNIISADFPENASRYNELKAEKDYHTFEQEDINRPILNDLKQEKQSIEDILNRSYSVKTMDEAYKQAMQRKKEYFEKRKKYAEAIKEADKYEIGSADWMMKIADSQSISAEQDAAWIAYYKSMQEFESHGKDSKSKRTKRERLYSGISSMEMPDEESAEVYLSNLQDYLVKLNNQIADREELIELTQKELDKLQQEMDELSSHLVTADSISKKIEQKKQEQQKFEREETDWATQQNNKQTELDNLNEQLNGVKGVTNHLKATQEAQQNNKEELQRLKQQRDEQKAIYDEAVKIQQEKKAQLEKLNQLIAETEAKESAPPTTPTISENGGSNSNVPSSGQSGEESPVVQNIEEQIAETEKIIKAVQIKQRELQIKKNELEKMLGEYGKEERNLYLLTDNNKDATEYWQSAGAGTKDPATGAARQLREKGQTFQATINAIKEQKKILTSLDKESDDYQQAEQKLQQLRDKKSRDWIAFYRAREELQSWVGNVEGNSRAKQTLNKWTPEKMGVTNMSFTQENLDKMIEDVKGQENRLAQMRKEVVNYQTELDSLKTQLANLSAKKDALIEEQARRPNISQQPDNENIPQALPPTQPSLSSSGNQTADGIQQEGTEADNTADKMKALADAKKEALEANQKLAESADATNNALKGEGDSAIGTEFNALFLALTEIYDLLSQFPVVFSQFNQGLDITPLTEDFKALADLISGLPKEGFNLSLGEGTNNFIEKIDDALNKLNDFITAFNTQKNSENVTDEYTKQVESIKQIIEETQKALETNQKLVESANAVNKAIQNESIAGDFNALIIALSEVYELVSKLPNSFADFNKSVKIEPLIKQIKSLSDSLNAFSKTKFNESISKSFDQLNSNINKTLKKIIELSTVSKTEEISKGITEKYEKQITKLRQELNEAKKALKELEALKQRLKTEENNSTFNSSNGRTYSRNVVKRASKQQVPEIDPLTKEYGLLYQAQQESFKANNIDEYNAALEKSESILQRISELEQKIFSDYGKNPYQDELLSRNYSQLLQDNSQNKNNAQASKNSIKNFVEKQNAEIQNLENSINNMQLIPEEAQTNWDQAYIDKYNSIKESAQEATTTIQILKETLAQAGTTGLDQNTLRAFLEFKQSATEQVASTQKENDTFKSNIASMSNEYINKLSEVENRLLTIKKNSEKLINIDPSIGNTLIFVEQYLNKIKDLKETVSKEPLAIYNSDIKGHIDSTISELTDKKNEEDEQSMLEQMEQVSERSKTDLDRIVNNYSRYTTALNKLFTDIAKGSKSSADELEKDFKRINDFSSKLVNATGLEQGDLLKGELKSSASPRIVDAQTEAYNKNAIAFEGMYTKIESKAESAKNKIEEIFGDMDITKSLDEKFIGGNVEGFDEFVQKAIQVEKVLKNLKKIQETIKTDDTWLLQQKNADELRQTIATLETSLASVSKASSNFRIVDDLDVQELRASTKQYIRDNPALTGGEVSELNNYIDQLQNKINTVDFKNIEDGIKSVQQTAKEAGHTGDTFMSMLTQRFKSLGAYLLSFVSFYEVIGVFKQGINIIHELDDALTEMQKVSDESLASLREYQQGTFATANEIGTTAAQLQQSTADWLRLGEDLQQASQSAQTANVLFNVSEFESIDEATTALVAMSAAYADVEKGIDKMDIVDRLNLIGNNYAIATDELATALQDGAATLQTAGNDLDQAIALTTAGNLITQDASKTGKGIRTIALRLTGTKEAAEELEEMGEDTSDMIMSQSKMRDLIMNATKVASNNYQGFDIQDELGRYKSTFEIMLGLAQIWDEIQQADFKTGDNRQNLLLESIAGKNRASIAASILQNPETLQSVYEDSSTKAAGSAMEENEKYLQSISGHIAKLTNAWQEMWANAANRDVINAFIDLATILVNLINKVGLLGSAFVLVWGGSILKGLATADSWLVKFIQGLNEAKTSSQSLGDAFEKIFSRGNNNENEVRLKGLEQIRKDKENRTKPPVVTPTSTPEVIENTSEPVLDMAETATKNTKADASRNAAQANMEEMASEEALKTAQQENIIAETEETVTKTEGASASRQAVQENIKEAESIKLTTEAIKEKAAVEALQYQNESPQKYKGRKKRRMPQHDQKTIEAELVEYYQSIADTADEAAEASMDWTLAYVGGFDKIEAGAEKTTGVFSKISTGFSSMLGTMSSGLSSLGSSLSSIFVTLATNPMTWLVGIPAAIGVATAVINHFAQSQQRLIDGAKEATNEWDQFDSTLTNYEQQYTDLAKQLENQNLSEAETLNIKEQIFSLQKQITDEYGKSANGINLVNGSLDEQLEKMRQLRIESQAENYVHNAKEYDNAIEKMATPQPYNQMTLTHSEGEDDYLKQLKDAVKDTGFTLEETEDGLAFKLHENAEASEEDLSILQEALTKVQKQMGAKWDDSQFEKFNTKVLETIKVNDAFLAQHKDARDTGLEGKFFDLADTDDISMYFDYQQAQSDYNQALLTNDDKKIAETQEAWHKLQAQRDEYLNKPDSNNSQFAPLFDQYDKQVNESLERAYEVRKQMESDENKTLVEQAFGTYKENRQVSKENQKAVLEASKAVLKEWKQASKNNKEIDMGSTAMMNLAKTAKDAKLPIGQIIDSLQSTGGISALQQSLEGTRITAEEMKTAFLEGDEAITGLASQFGIDFNSPETEIDNFINKMAAMNGAVGDATGQSKSSLDRFYDDTSAKIEQLSSLTATLQKGWSQTGLSFTKLTDDQGNQIASEVKTITDAYKHLEGFDLGSLFEETATGIKLNMDAYRALAAEEEAEVKRQYKLERAALENQLATATGAKKADLQKQITELDMLSSAYDGATSALQKYLNQQNAPDYGDTYAMLRDTTIKRADELMGKGMIGTEEFRSIAQLFSFESLATTSASENVDAYLAGYEKVKKFFTEDNFTGMKTFADELTTLDEKFGTFTKENINGEDIYKFEASDDQIALLAEHYGVSVDLIESLFDQLKAMGFNIHFYRDGGFEDFEKLDKQIEESQTALKELKKTANDPNLIPDDLFNFNAADLDTPEELKQKIEDLQGIQTKLPVDSDEYKEAQKIIENLQAKLKEFEEHDEYSPKVTVTSYEQANEILGQFAEKEKTIQQMAESDPTLNIKATIQDDPQIQDFISTVEKLPPQVRTYIMAGLNVEGFDPVRDKDRIGELITQALQTNETVEVGVDPKITHEVASEFMDNGVDVKVRADTTDVKNQLEASPLANPYMNVTVNPASEEAAKQEVADTIGSAEPDVGVRTHLASSAEELEPLATLGFNGEADFQINVGADTSQANEVIEETKEEAEKPVETPMELVPKNTAQDAANQAGAQQGVNTTTTETKVTNEEIHTTATTDTSQIDTAKQTMSGLQALNGSTVSISVGVSGMEVVDSAKTNIEELIKKNKSKVVISINGNAALFNKTYTQTNSALNTLAKKVTEPKITANNSNLKDKVSNSKDRLNSIKDKSITITAHQSGFSTISTWKTNTYDKLKDKEIKVTTHYSYTGDPKMGKGGFQGSAHNQGTVISKGRAYAGGTLSGNWGLPKAEKGALINELGSEIIVTPDGHWQIMNSGDPTFVNLPKGSIIFNHKQSESLLKKGYINGSHGKMVGGAFATGTVNDENFDEDEFEGNAYAIGTTKWNGQLIGMSHATSGGGGFTGANKARNNSSNKSNKSSNKSNKSSNKNKGSSNKSNSSNKSSKDTLQTLDAIEIRLNRIDALISQLDATASKTYEGFSTRNKALKDDLATVNKEIAAINASLKSADTSRSYLKKAAAAAKEAGLKSGDEGYSAGSEGASGKALSQTWIKKIQNSVNSGQYFTLSDVRNEGLWKKIQAYQTWYEKYVKLQQKVQEQTAKLSQLTIQQLSLIQSQWEATLNTISANITTYQNRIDLLAEQGYNASEDYYTNQILENQRKVNALTSEASDLQKKLDEAVKTGRVKQYSEEWFKWYNQIKGIKNEIIATNKEMQTLLNSIRQLRWDKFDHGQERLADLADEMEFLGGLINEIDLFDKDTGIITDKGKAAFGLEAQRYDIYIKQAQKYKEAVKELNKEINEDFKTNKKYNQTLIEQRDTWLKAQREAIENAHSEKEAIADLVEKGIKKQIEAMEELIDKYEEALDAEKDQQKYADDIAEKQKKINSLQKQLRAMEGDDSEEGASRRQKLRDELKEAQKDLQETQEDQRISDIKEALSNMQERYEEVLNARIDDIDALLEEVVSGVNQNGADICGTIKGVATSVGYNITSALNNIYTGVQNLNSNVANAKNQSGALVSGSTDNGSASNTSAKTLTESTTPSVPVSPTMPSNNSTSAKKTTTSSKKTTTSSKKTTTSSKNGLIKENGKTYYYKNNKKQTAWQTINGKKYYFSVKDGAMLTGVQKIGNKYYLLDSKTGALKNTYTGLYKQGTSTYYFKSGNIQTGWRDMKEGRRYFSVNTGKMLTGLQRIGNDDYYFNSNGILQTGTFNVDAYTYETDKDGKIKKKTARTGTIVMKTVSNGSNKNISSNIPGIGTIKGKLASGTSSVVRSGMYRVDEEGNEVFINKQGKIYTRLGKGTTVLPHDAAVNLLKGMSDPVNFIASHMDMRPNKNISTTNNTNGDTINNITFEMNGITNYAEFMREAQRDPNFTKYIQEISIGKLNGHNSLKGNSIRFR